MQTSANIDQKSQLRVRPEFLYAGIAVLAVFMLPDAVRGQHLVKFIFFWVATASILLGWFFLLNDSSSKDAKPHWIANVASVYLALSLPAFFFEMSQVKWLILHPMRHIFSIYVSPWVYWHGFFGILLICFGLVGTFFEHGKARLMFFVGGVTLMVLYFSMGAWLR